MRNRRTARLVWVRHMTSALSPHPVPAEAPVQTYARLAGVLGLLSIVGGGFGEAYVPSVLIDWSDPAATTTKILSSESMFRWGFAAYLLEALCDTGLTLLLYLLLRPVRRDVALLAVLFRIISTAGFAMAMVLHFAALPIAKGAAGMSAFPSDQLSALALLSLRTSSYGQTVFTTFYGVGALLTGWLMYRSGFLPRIIGILFAVTGAGFVAKTLTFVLAPAYSSPLLLAPAAAAGLAMTGWLLVKGVDVERWRERAALAAAA